MPDYLSIEHNIHRLLASDRRPVAVCFPDAPPGGIAKFEGSEPSSRSFWRIAAQIETIQSANRTLTDYHQERRRTLTIGAPPKEQHHA